MIRSSTPYPILLLLIILQTGCLTVENKEYRIKLRNDQSGDATIRFINIHSESEDSADISSDDFRQLIEFYLEGNQFETDNPGIQNVRKKLYESAGVLTGEVTFSFDSLAAVRLFKFDRSSPYMYLTGNPLSREQLVESNGTRGPEWMPVVFWSGEVTDIYFKTRVVSEVSFRQSLLKNFQGWQATEHSQKKQ